MQPLYLPNAELSASETSGGIMSQLADTQDSTALSARESRVVGALLGVHAGDCLGATVEFAPHDYIAEEHPDGVREIIGGGPFSWAAGHATDDTDMTRGVLLAYRDLQPGDDIARLAGDYFVRWLRGDWPGREKGSSPVDIGGATQEGLTNYEKSRDPDRSGAGPEQAGNGSLMRCIPTGLFQMDLQKLIVESERISKITHDDKRCTISCAAYNTIASKLIAGDTPLEAIAAGQEVARSLEGASFKKVSKAIELGKTLSISKLAQKGPSSQLPGHCSGFVIESLNIAIAAILDTRSLEDVLVDVVRIGWDTDTNAAIAGGLLGARDGAAAIPQRWRDKLQFGNEFTSVALEILRR
ncbi:ADP-ribosylglycohydrolase [Paramyrothecium foliicola]|nr:ADP-ribosylglycohydrolase [Paramyrothecium foliicola]